MKREDMYTTTEVLLFDILQELKEFNKNFALHRQVTSMPVTTTFYGVQPNSTGVLQKVGTVTTSSSNLECIYCGKVHPNLGLAKACEKKNKKEGAKKNGK